MLSPTARVGQRPVILAPLFQCAFDGSERERDGEPQRGAARIVDERQLQRILVALGERDIEGLDDLAGQHTSRALGRKGIAENRVLEFYDSTTGTEIDYWDGSLWHKLPVPNNLANGGNFWIEVSPNEPDTYFFCYRRNDGVAKVKNGNVLAARYVLEQLGMKSRGGDGYEWGTASAGADCVEFQALKMDDNLVPDVLGMGAKDAVYALSSRGMNVRMRGKGRVTLQSVASGTKVVKGKTVSLVLK